MIFQLKNVNNSISPRVTALHPADLESGDSGAIESTIKHCMDAKARFSPKMAFGPRLQLKLYFQFPSVFPVFFLCLTTNSLVPSSVICKWLICENDLADAFSFRGK